MIDQEFKTPRDPRDSNLNPWSFYNINDNNRN